MYVYSVNQNGEPEYLSSFAHVLSCDPVIVNPPFAYVTLRMTSSCRIGFNTNQLDILDIQDLASPKLRHSYPMPEPHGLSVDGDYLFICHGKEGLGVYNVQNPDSLKEISTIKGIETFDVISDKQRLLVIGPSGLYQYDYSDINKINLLSKIEIGH
jgi:hypothetical protein